MSHPRLAKPNKLVPAQHVAHLLLHSTKPHEPARLTLEMTEQASKGAELLATAAIRAVIHRLLMHRRVEMLIEARLAAEAALADVAPPVRAIPRLVGGGVGRCRLLVPADLLLGDDAAGVALADDLEDGVAVEVRSALAGAGLEVVAQAAGAGVVDLAEGAGDGGAAVETGVAVLMRWSAIPDRMNGDDEC